MRLVDRWNGRRDGRAGIPLPARVPLSTPYRDRLIGWARAEYEQERLAYQAIRAEDQRRLAAAQTRRRAAEAALALARTRAGELAVRPAEPVLTQRRLGEEDQPERMVRLRRLREHARRLTAGGDVVRAAQADVKAAGRELAAGRKRLRRHAEAAGERVRQVHALCHQRLAWYRYELLRCHPRGGLVAQAMDVLEPALPEWLREQAGLAEPEPLPPALDPLPALDPPPAPDPVGEAYPIRGRLVLGSSAARADIVLRGCGIGAEHAVVARKGDRVLLRDLSRGGTFRDGRPVRRAQLTPGVAFDVAEHRFQVNADGNWLIRTHIGGFGLVVSGLSSQVRGGPELTRMSFTQRAGTVLALLEPSEPDTSALFLALLGQLPSSGALYFHGMNMRTHFHQIRTWTGFVPRRPDLDRSALSEVRLSIAAELMAGPRLLMLDAPVSGLGRRAARAVMTDLRRVAAGGCTVLLSTRSMRDLRFADQVVVAGTKGRVVFSGDPAALPAALGADNDAELRKVLAAFEKSLARKYFAGPEASDARRRAAAAAGKAWDTRGTEE
ncbi:FHA domain-containing protein [Amycolatopsis nigrescens]|uniref:FHA domain-containing protein n=1 Tax=Amycolatopsis nigrescens TaxID=381445 RepID=UPI00146B4D39|nr:FHA domain-containing protein [Amycolatopsis nigrescens]